MTDLMSPHVDGIRESLGLVDPVDGAAIIANSRKLGPLIEQEAAEIERTGALTQRVMDALVSAGCFRIGFPKRLGGPELSFRDQVTVIETLSSADGSVGWNVKILSDSGFYAARLSAEAYADLYPSIDAATCGSFNPLGRADVVPDGYEVTGNWQYGSGIKSAHQIVAGVNIYRDGELQRHDDGRAMVLGVYLPRESVTIEDDWIVTGMRGSSSNSYRVSGVFVPESHAFVRSALPNLSREPLNRHVELLFFNHVGITLGLADHALRIACDKIMRGDRPAAERESTRQQFGEAWSLLGAARALAYEIADELSEALFERGEILSPELFARMTTITPTTAELCKRVVDLCVQMNGSVTIYANNPLERVNRDMQTNLVHMTNRPNRWGEVASWVLLGRSSMG